MPNNTPMKVVFGCDHGGIQLKNHLMEVATKLGHDVVDASRTTGDSVDYPDEARHAASVFQKESADFLVLVCGSGVGVSIAANRHSFLRAVLTDNPYVAGLARAHNHANCICFGERTMGRDTASAALKAFLEGPADSDSRHQRRVQKLEEPCPMSS